MDLMEFYPSGCLFRDEFDHPIVFLGGLLRVLTQISVCSGIFFSFFAWRVGRAMMLVLLCRLAG